MQFGNWKVTPDHAIEHVVTGYDLTRREIESRGVDFWVEHLSRKMWLRKERDPMGDFRHAAYYLLARPRTKFIEEQR